MIIYFQSINDIITNSSSEVYTIYNQAGIKTIKNIVNSILAINNSKYTCDNLFEFKLYIVDWAAEDYEDSKHEWEGEKVSFEDFAKLHDNQQLEYGEGPLYIQGIEIIPKINTVEVEEAAKCLTRIGEIFDTQILY